jgi:hypothetical protein
MQVDVTSAFFATKRTESRFLLIIDDIKTFFLLFIWYERMGNEHLVGKTQAMEKALKRNKNGTQNENTFVVTENVTGE